MFFKKEPPPREINYMYFTPLALIPVWYFWGNWAYVSKATFQSGMDLIDIAMGKATQQIKRLVGRVDEMEHKALLKFGELRRDLAHVETMIATLMEKSNAIEAEARCAAQGVKVLCRTVSAVIDDGHVNKQHTLQELRAVVGV